MIARLLAAVVAGLTIWLSFPAHSLWWCAPVGVALLALACAGARIRTGVLVGLVAGEAMFVPTLSWSGIYVGKLPWFALATLESLYVAALGGVLAAAGGRGRAPRVRPLVVALAWVASEYARGTTPFGGFPWARLAFGQTDGPFLGVAALLGAPGVTFVVALLGGVLAGAVALLLGRRSRRRDPAAATSPRRGIVGVVAGIAVVLALSLAGARTPAPAASGTANVMAIQGDVPQAGLDFNAQRRAVLDNHARVTRQAAQAVRSGTYPRPDLVLWPENASDIDPLVNPDAARVIRDAVADIGAPTVVGAVLEGPGAYVSNASLLYRPGADTPVARYVKQRPAPFAEYIPYRSFFRHFSDKVDLVQRDFVHGQGIGVFSVPAAAGGNVSAALNICFEVAFDDLVRDGVTHGADLITVQTNNATFGSSDESVQQLAISRLRAVEHGRTVVHISNVGVSAIVTPDGQMHQVTPAWTPAVMADTVTLSHAHTLATVLGPWPERVASAALLVVLAASILLTRRRATLGRIHRSDDRGDR